MKNNYLERKNKVKKINVNFRMSKIEYKKVCERAREMGIDQAEIRYKNFIPPFDGVEVGGEVSRVVDLGNVPQTVGFGALDAHWPVQGDGAAQSDC